MIVSKKTVIWAAVAAVALFAIADPLGDSKHGLGKHHKFLADLGQTLFVASLCGAVVVVVLIAIAFVQHGRSRTATRRQAG